MAGKVDLPGRVSRRAALGGLTLAGLSPLGGRAAEPPHDITAALDFDEMWRTLDERYCFFDQKKTDWAKVKAVYRPLAVAAEDADAYKRVLVRAMHELYDPHTHVHDVPDGALRFPGDLLVERDGAAASIVAIQDDSNAAASGLRIGERIVGIDGLTVAAEIAQRALLCQSGPDPAADAYVLNCAVSGHAGRPRRFAVEGEGGRRTVDVAMKPAPERPDVEGRRLEGGVGYIAVRTFGNDKVAAAFDTVMDGMRDAPGLVLDLRNNGGGDTAQAKPMMGRFIKEAKPYAFMRRRLGPERGRGLTDRWTESVDPHGAFTYEKPVVVLVGQWSASMAEGFPMGMHDIGRARLVGQRMMGLGAGVFQLRLDLTGVDIQYSAEPIFDSLTDRSRSLLRPDVEVPYGGDTLKAGLAELHRMMGS